MKRCTAAKLHCLDRSSSHPSTRRMMPWNPAVVQALVPPQAYKDSVGPLGDKKSGVF